MVATYAQNKWHICVHTDLHTYMSAYLYIRMSISLIAWHVNNTGLMNHLLMPCVDATLPAMGMTIVTCPSRGQGHRLDSSLNVRCRVEESSAIIPSANRKHPTWKPRFSTESLHFMISKCWRVLGKSLVVGFGTLSLINFFKQSFGTFLKHL